METLTFASVRGAILLLLALLAYAAGRRLLQRLTFDSLAEEVSTSCIVGLGLIETLIFVLGLARLLYASTMIVAAAAILLLGRYELAHLAGELRSKSTRQGIAVGVLVAAALAPLFWSGLYPPHIWDELSYHLPSARYFAAWHALAPTPTLRYCVFPQLNQMLFTAMFLVADDVAAQLTQFLALLLTAATLVGASRRLFQSSRSGWWAAAAWVGTPLALVLGTSAYIDVGLTMYCTAGVIAYMNWRSSGEDWWSLVSGLCCGWATASKYGGLYFLAGILMLVAFRSVRVRRWRPVVTFLIAGLVVSLPWYARNYLYSGDILFPSGTKLTACGWSARDFDFQARDLDVLGVEKTPANAFRLPWDLAFNQKQYLLESPFSPVIALSFPLALWPMARRRWLGGVGLLLLGYCLAWFTSAQVPRYLLPIVPCLALLEAEGFRSLLSLSPILDRRRAATVITVALSFLLLAPSYQSVRKFRRVVGKVPADARGRDRFFLRYHGQPCYRYLNRHYGASYRVAAFDPVYMSYFAEGERLGDVLGPYRYKTLNPSDGLMLAGSMKKVEAQFALFSEQDGDYKHPADSYFSSHFELVCASTGTTLWRLHDRPVSRQLLGQRLNNPGFEESLSSWTSRDAERSPGVARSGAASVKLLTDGVVSQEASIRGDSLYLLQFWLAGGVSGRVRVHVSWLAADGEELGITTRRSPAGSAWAAVEVPMRSWPESVKASISVVAEEGPLWIDDITLKSVHYNRAPVGP